MYRRILVAAENSPPDRTIPSHVSALPRLTAPPLLPAPPPTHAPRVGGDESRSRLPRSPAARARTERLRGRGAPGDGRPRGRARQGLRGAGRRSDRDVDPRPSLRQGRTAGRDRRQGAPPREGP